LTCENCAAALAALTAERDEARETIRRLNRRCQEAEAAVAEKVQAHPHASLGRALANAAASAAEAERDRLREALKAVVDHWDDYDEGEWGPEDPEGRRILARALALVGPPLWSTRPGSVHPASERPNAPAPPGAEALAKSASASSSVADTAKEGT
jgi:hypothetical protein